MKTLFVAASMLILPVLFVSPIASADDPLIACPLRVPGYASVTNWVVPNLGTGNAKIFVYNPNNNNMPPPNVVQDDWYGEISTVGLCALVQEIVLCIIAAITNDPTGIKECLFGTGSTVEVHFPTLNASPVVTNLGPIGKSYQFEKV